jgi:hypothetical protein
MTDCSKDYTRTGRVNICVGNQKLHLHQQFQQRAVLGTAQSGVNTRRLVGVKIFILVACCNKGSFIDTARRKVNITKKQET